MIIEVPAPAASAATQYKFTESAEAGVRQLRSVFCNVSTTAVAGNRLLFLRLLSKQLDIIWKAHTVTLPASSSYELSWISNWAVISDNGVNLVTAPVPLTVLDGGETIEISAANFLPGDQFGVMRLDLI